MRRIIGIILAVIVLLFLFYVVFIYEGPDVDVKTRETAKTEKTEKDKNKENKKEVSETDNRDFKKVVSAEGYNDKLSMKEIDSIRAANNLWFTIDNKIRNKPYKDEFIHPQRGKVPSRPIDTTDIVIIETNL